MSFSSVRGVYNAKTLALTLREAGPKESSVIRYLSLKVPYLIPALRFIFRAVRGLYPTLDAGIRSRTPDIGPVTLAT